VATSDVRAFGASAEPAGAGEGEQAMKNLKRVSLAMIFALILSGLVAWAQDEPYDDQQPVQDQQASPADRSNQPDPP